MAVLQDQVWLAAQLLRHHDAGASGVEMQRRPTLPQERQESLLLRWSLGGAHAPRSGLRPARVLLGSRQDATATFMTPSPRRCERSFFLHPLRSSVFCDTLPG